MEHIVQFAIGIDDEAIKSRIEDSATKQIVDSIVKSLKSKINDAMFDRWGNGFSEDSKKLITDFLTEYKEEILQNAANQVADSIKRGKRYKEVVAKLFEETDE